MFLINLTLKSILNRKLTTFLLILSIALSSMLLMGIQKIKQSAKESFSHSISGTDLLVGSRSSDLQLLLYLVFRQGRPIANISWDSIQDIKALRKVSWLIPLSLGDSHRGYPVLGTSIDYFTHFKYGRKQPLTLKKGRIFRSNFDVVIGSDIAQKLGYNLGDKIYLAHGLNDTPAYIHKEFRFKIVGILNTTGTPVDKTIHVPLEGFTALHIDAKKINRDDLLANESGVLTPQFVTGALVGLKSKFSLFNVQREITSWSKEPLMAIIPGVTLSRLWNNIRQIDSAFWIITILVIIIAFIGVLMSLFLNLQNKRRELSILRTMGAHPYQLFLKLMSEALFIITSGIILGICLTFLLGMTIKPYLESKMGVILNIYVISGAELMIMGLFLCFGLLISLFPALLVYRDASKTGITSL